MQLPGTSAIALAASNTATQPQIEKAARALETQFAQMLIKSMRSTTPGDPLGGDSGYRDMSDQQLAKTLTQGRGLGLSSMIQRQLQRSNGLADVTTPLDARLPAARDGGMQAFPLDGGAAPGLELPARVPSMQMQMQMQMQNPIAPPSLPGSGLSLSATHSGVSLQAVPVAAMPVAPTPPADPDCALDCSSPEAFVQSIWPHAQKAAAELGVPARALVAQAALETGWGRRLAGEGGTTSNNLFGVKAGGRWSGDRVDSATHEYVDGVRRSERASFRAYGSAAESFADYTRLLGNDRYAGARGTGEDTRRFASALQRAGYATDPRYAAKLTAIANGPTIDRALARLDPQAMPGAADTRIAARTATQTDALPVVASAGTPAAGSHTDTALFATLAAPHRAVAGY